MRVIGTAGHVDHGKSTLVQALTGTHPDRLKEEREREMTIDLGFAWMTLEPDEILPNGEEVGIVDVPGHRDFIENMLSGVGGIDAALFVIAADEGPMPQTREHLAILDLLQIESGVVVLTKIDLVQEPEWLELIEDDLRHILQDTVLENAPVVRVSSVTGEGLSGLVRELRGCLAKHPPRRDLGKPRLPIDRVFTIAGFGTVVTGTLIDGSLKVGDEVEVLGGSQSGLKGRVRGLQTHKRKEDLAVPGSRTAVNISGLSVEEIQRGNVIAHPGDYKETRRIDVHFKLLKDALHPLRHNFEVKLFSGATEVVARIRLLGVEELLPGEQGWLQLELETPIVAVRGDHYILRRPSPGETLGGGVVVDSHPKKRHKRFAEATLSHLETLSQGVPADILYQTIASFGSASFGEIVDHANLGKEIAQMAVQELIVNRQILVLDSEIHSTPSRQSLVASRVYWDRLVEKTMLELEKYHQVNSLRKGMPKEELKSRLKISPRLFNALFKYLLYIGSIEESGPYVFRKGHVIRFTQAQQEQVESLFAEFRAAPYAPPTVKDCIATLKEDLFYALVDLGELTFVPPDVVFRSEDYNRMVVTIRKLLEEHGTVTAAQVRDHFNTSRRYVLAVLEHLDALGITVREGDVRRLKV
jgi:selenocysteine-specific elongation factor